MHKKYQLMLDIHRGSMSLVATPAWSMLLNLMVKGKGSFTVMLMIHSLAWIDDIITRKQAWHKSPPRQVHTNNITTEKGIDPAHDQRVWNDHGHLVFHHAHHAVHRAGVTHGVRGRLSTTLGIFEKGTGLVGRGQGISSRIERFLGEGVEVGAHVDAMDEGALLADCFAVLLLGGCCHQDRGVVAKDACEDLYPEVAVRNARHLGSWE